MKRILWLLPIILLLAACTAPAPKADPAEDGTKQTAPANSANSQAEEYPADEPVPEPIETSTRYVTAANVNLRTGPGTDQDIITTVSQNTIVIVTDFRDYEWFKVEYDGQMGYMKAEFLIGAAPADTAAGTATDTETTEVDSSVFFVALEYQLLPPEQVLDAEFAQVYQTFTAAVREKDLAVIDSFLADDTTVSFGGQSGKEDFHEYWNLNDHADQSALWETLQQIISLGGTYDAQEKRFTAPYTYSIFPLEFDSFEHCAITGSGVSVYAEENTGSAVIEYLNYNIIRVNWANNSNLWDKNAEDLVKIQTPAGQVGYVQKKYVRSPIDYRFSLMRNGNGEWKLGYMVAGD